MSQPHTTDQPMASSRQGSRRLCQRGPVYIHIFDLVIIFYREKRGRTNTLMGPPQACQRNAMEYMTYNYFMKYMIYSLSMSKNDVAVPGRVGIEEYSLNLIILN